MSIMAQTIVLAFRIALVWVGGVILAVAVRAVLVAGLRAYRHIGLVGRLRVVLADRENNRRSFAPLTPLTVKL